MDLSLVLVTDPPAEKEPPPVTSRQKYTSLVDSKLPNHLDDSYTAGTHPRPFKYVDYEELGNPQHTNLGKGTSTFVKSSAATHELSLRRNPFRAAKTHRVATSSPIKKPKLSILPKPAISPTPSSITTPFARTHLQLFKSTTTHADAHDHPELLLDYGALWCRFHQLNNEMIITKSGRCLFPSLKVLARGLDPDATYSIMLDFVQLSPYRYRFRRDEWVCIGKDQRKFGLFNHDPYGPVKPGTEKEGQLDEMEDVLERSHWMNLGQSKLEFTVSKGFWNTDFIVFWIYGNYNSSSPTLSFIPPLTRRLLYQSQAHEPPDPLPTVQDSHRNRHQQPRTEFHRPPVQL
ncbi:T-box-domain-containing protein [Jimgerdemannia flammicorona]|uniref:T-box-domain-containing protein n=1 Tax=Jimgerdemannia flammicorona TaxID=994334 RepID=A0A433DGH8_9FUNG|nr:T-box-domain-containing protein [Jimgerdemannia flammicorona]